MQCPGCKDYICGGILKNTGDRQEATYLRHYPIGTPRADVADEVPEPIASDLREALKCMFLDCFKAAVTMSRRAVQASCREQGAKGRNLYYEIDDLASQRKITESLKVMAHAVRLVGAKGAHPNKVKPDGEKDSELALDGLDDITQEDALAVIEFTKQFFLHIYVMPARAKQYTSKPTQVD